MTDETAAHRILQESIPRGVDAMGLQIIFIDWRSVYKKAPHEDELNASRAAEAKYEAFIGRSPTHQPIRGEFVDEFKLYGPDGSWVAINTTSIISLLNHLGQRGWEVFQFEVKNAVYTLKQEGGSEAPTNVPVWKRYWLKRPQFLGTE